MGVIGMSTASNPYVVGPPVAGPVFFGRQDVFKFVQETLVASQQNAIVLYGQRRMGKTSILRELPDHLPKARFHTVYFDLQWRAADSLSGVLHDLASEIAKSLEVSPPPQKAFSAGEDYFRKSFLPGIYDRLEKRRLILLFDEFDVLSDVESRLSSAAADALFPYLRGLLNTEKKRLSFVFVVGRQLDQLPHWILRIFKDTQYKFVWLLDRRDAEALITNPVKGILTYQPRAIDELLKLTSCHPYFTQLMCYEIFNAKKDTQSASVPVDEVRAVVPVALETGVPAFEWIWEGLDQNSRLLLSAIAEVTAEGRKANPEIIQRTLAKNHVRLSAGEWRDSLKILVEWGILERDEADHVSFVVELARRWVLKSQPLREIKSDITRTLLSRVQMAEEAHRRGKYDEAIELYRQVLKRNPNHPGAQLGLATALQDQGRLPEAVKAFEEAYWSDKLHSRDGLVKTRLDLGEQLEREGKYQEAAIQFRRILELDPDHRDVLGKIKLLYDQGMIALSTDQLDQAVEYFDRVALYKEDYRNVGALLRRARSKRNRLQGKDDSSGPGALLLKAGAVAAILLALGGGGYFAYSNFLTPPTPIITPTPASIAANTTPDTPTPAIVVVTATPTASAIPGPTDTPSPTPTPTVTPTPVDTATPMIIVVTVTPLPTSTSTPSPTLTPTPIPTPSLITSPAPVFKYDAPTLLRPDNGVAFHGEDAIIEIRWEPVPGGLSEDEFYAISFRYTQEKKIQYSGDDTKEPFWRPQGSLFYLKADQPERRYEWDVTVVQVGLDAEGEKVAVPLSPTSETRFFTWGD